MKKYFTPVLFCLCIFTIMCEASNMMATKKTTPAAQVTPKPPARQWLRARSVYHKGDKNK